GAAAVEHGHVQIHQDEVGPVLARGQHGFAAIGGGHHHKALPLQTPHQHVAAEFIVFRQEQFGHGQAPRFAGIRMVKSEPFPGSLRTEISPPIRRHILRLMARPKPVPPYFRVVEASPWEKAWNSRVCCSGAMPMPVSFTLTTSHSLGPARSRRASTETSPSLVNLHALATRLSRLWRKRVRSA